WWWTVVLEWGAAFTAGYVVLVLTEALRRPAGAAPSIEPVSRLSEFAALALAVSSLLLAIAALGPLPADLISNPLKPAELGSTLLAFAGGALLALGLSRQSLLRPGGPSGAVRRTAVAAGVAFEHTDAYLRRWSSAGIALLSLAALFAGLLLAQVLP
ncbi:MAG TPA: hypothetical protein VLT59_02320, partial [Steroidobacteraceae bacterium]|nr:hypothetical protein [Steroidobacteraceae bacterium]